MTYLDFIHRTTKPDSPRKGVFYWVETETGTQIWFSPGEKTEDLILLNKDLSVELEELKTRLDEGDSDVENIENEIKGIKNGLEDYLKKDELKLKTVNGNELTGDGDITISAELTEEDINTIAEKVNITGLVWKIVK